MRFTPPRTTPRAIGLILLCLLFVAAGAAPGYSQNSALTFKVYASPAPNRHTSDNSPAKNAYNTWVGRALRWAEGDRSNMGNPGRDPGAFAAVSTVKPREYMVTASNSWRGAANPIGAFAGQHGNRVHFVLHVKGNGTVRFKYEDISWRYWAGGAPWGSTRTFGSPAEQVDCTHGWGYDWGNDRVKGGGDDSKVCNDNTTLVDELFFVGAGYGLTSDRCFTEPSYAAKCAATTGFTLQQVLHWYCDGLNKSVIDDPMGMAFTITGSDSNTYTYTAKRSNPEFNKKLNPATCVAYPDPPEEAPVATAAPTSVPVHTGESMAAQGYFVSAAHGLRSGVQFQRVGAAGVGNAAALAAGFIDAIDVWGYAEQGVTVCFPNPPLGAGLLFLDATAAPRTLTPLASFYGDNQICATIYRPGTIVLVSSGAPTPAPVSATSRPLSDCMVTTQYTLNFRETPSLSGKKIGTGIPYEATLTALARAADWFKVDFHGVQGWISAQFVAATGDCD